MGMPDSFAQVRLQIDDASAFDIPYIIMNTLATIVACYGMLANSPAVVIGAMIIAMLLGPISGVGLALVDGDQRLLRKALTALLGGVVVVVITAFAIGFAHRDIPVTHEIMARTSPNLFDLMIALAGGAACAYSAISPRLSIAFVGAAIATALVPPLSSCGLLLARGNYLLAGGAFLLASTNIIGIQAAASLVMWVSGLRTRKAKRMWLPDLASVAVLIILVAILGNNLSAMVRNALFEASVTKTINRELVAYPGTFVNEIRIAHKEVPGKTIVRAVLRGPQGLSAQQVGALEDQLPRPSDGTHVELRIRGILTTVMTRNGPLFSASEATHMTE
jgi:uncharacterized hydrophobic protein (TIGR00271 family)